MLDFVKVIKPKSIIPWTECEISTLEFMKSCCQPGEISAFQIPPRIINKFPYLQSQVLLDLRSSKSLSTEINNITTGINNLNTPSIGLDCWSPSPPLSPISSEQCTEEAEILECGTLKRKFSVVDFAKEENVNCKKQRIGSEFY